MSAMPDLGTGLGAFLSGALGRPVAVTNLQASSAGARRTNILFDAMFTDAGSGESGLRLCATIVPTAEILINPVGAEAAVRTVAERAGVPVPHIHAVCLDSTYVGGPFFVSDRVDGESVPRRVLRLVHGLGIGEKVAAQLGDALARLHSIDVAEAPTDLSASDRVDPAAGALAQTELMLRDLLSPRPALLFGMQWLERHCPGPPARRAILHTDARNGNLMVGPDGLAAILDWEGARRGGDPMEDLAWPALRMWRFREDEREIGGFARREPFVAAYEAAGGTFDEDRFRWWKVFGTFRWALGLAGQAQAHLDGRFSNIVMAASGRRVAELEWDLLMLLRPRR